MTGGYGADIIIYEIMFCSKSLPSMAGVLAGLHYLSGGNLLKESQKN